LSKDHKWKTKKIQSYTEMRDCQKNQEPRRKKMDQYTGRQHRPDETSSGGYVRHVGRCNQTRAVRPEESLGSEQRLSAAELCTGVLEESDKHG